MSGHSEIVSKFWQQWLEHQDSLYQCCLKLMNWNHTEAEEALHEAMVKASEKVREYTTNIANLKAWLHQMTRNHCIDIIRKRSKSATGVESIEWVGDEEDIGTVTPVKTPEQALETDEKYIEIRGAIASLPERLRSTFILHFYEELKHPEIAEIQGISYDNVCKRISLARKMLKEKLSGHFIGEEGKVDRLALAGTEKPTPQKKKRLKPQVSDLCEEKTTTGTEAPKCVWVVV